MRAFVLSIESSTICPKIYAQRARYVVFGHAKTSTAWWRHQMETFSALLAICAGNSPVTGEFSAQRPVTRSCDVFFDLHLKTRLSKQSRGWWFGTPSRPLWRHCNGFTHNPDWGIYAVAIGALTDMAKYVIHENRINRFNCFIFPFTAHRPSPPPHLPSKIRNFKNLTHNFLCEINTIDSLKSTLYKITRKLCGEPESRAPRYDCQMTAGRASIAMV